MKIVMTILNQDLCTKVTDIQPWKRILVLAYRIRNLYRNTWASKFFFKGWISYFDRIFWFLWFQSNSDSQKPPSLRHENWPKNTKVTDIQLLKKDFWCSRIPTFSLWYRLRYASTKILFQGWISGTLVHRSWFSIVITIFICHPSDILAALKIYTWNSEQHKSNV